MTSRRSPASRSQRSPATPRARPAGIRPATANSTATSNTTPGDSAGEVPGPNSPTRRTPGNTAPRRPGTVRKSNRPQGKRQPSNTSSAPTQNAATSRPSPAAAKPTWSTSATPATTASAPPTVAPTPLSAAAAAWALRTDGPRWTFLTNHAHVLVLLYQNPALTVREVARQVGITERAVQSILAELESAGILERTRVGRQNHYRIEPNVSLRHPIEAHRTIGELLQLCARPSE